MSLRHHLLASLFVLALIANGEDTQALPNVDASGAISFPADFRLGWAHLGSWSLKDQVHEVYTRPENIASFRKNGVFPDGTVLVKEVRGADKGIKTTGDDQWASDTVIQWFVMVKDTQNRFPNNPLWKDGWGWALFKADAPTKQVATNYAADCMGCHIPAAATDRVYTEGYPVLRAILAGSAPAMGKK